MILVIVEKMTDPGEPRYEVTRKIFNEENLTTDGAIERINSYLELEMILEDDEELKVWAFVITEEDLKKISGA